MVENILILDACALIAYLNKEEGGDVVKVLLQDNETGNNLILLHSVNFLETYYDHKRNPAAPPKD